MKDMFEEGGDDMRLIGVKKSLDEGFRDNVLKRWFFREDEIFEGLDK